MSGRMGLRCPKCGKAFKHAGSLQSHLNFHREMDERRTVKHRWGEGTFCQPTPLALPA